MFGHRSEMMRICATETESWYFCWAWKTSRCLAHGAWRPWRHGWIPNSHSDSAIAVATLACFKKLAATPLAHGSIPVVQSATYYNAEGSTIIGYLYFFFHGFPLLGMMMNIVELYIYIYIIFKILMFAHELLSAKHSSSCSRSKLSIVGHGRPVLHPDVLYLYIQKYEGMSYLSFYVHK